MDTVVSAIAGDLVNRFISFLIKKHKSHANLEKKVERLQQLLLRVHMVIEEAERRYITNSRMLLELKRLAEAMYQGYHVLDTMKYRALCSSRDETQNLSCLLEDVSACLVALMTHDASWQKFYSTTKHMGKGSKIIIISRIESVSRLGTIRPMHLNGLSLEEYSYLFKVLAFGSTNPDYHPRLSLVASELAVLMGGSLVVANVCADIFRKNQNVQFWQHILNKYRNYLSNNLSLFLEHPKLLIERDRPVDIAKLVSSTSAPLRLMPPHSEDDDSTRDLPKVGFGDLIAGFVVPPKEEFELVGWESRIPPYKKYVNVAKLSDQSKSVAYIGMTKSPSFDDQW
uniref:Disease resistance N-terminal domain-containing protein n=1 Tax=Hordeum vulgare subsp. vulgare TaxID=112509 RepID=A0A8I6Y6B5_HORVV